MRNYYSYHFNNVQYFIIFMDCVTMEKSRGSPGELQFENEKSLAQEVRQKSDISEHRSKG